MKRTLLILARSRLGEYIVGVAFGKYSKLLPVERVKETDYVLAFKHPKPHWENHILLVPKKAIKNLHSVKSEDIACISEIFRVAQQIINENQWQDSSYQVIVNGGSRQEVPQLHFHLGEGKIL